MSAKKLQEFTDLQTFFNKKKFCFLKGFEMGYALSYPISQHVFHTYDGAFKNFLRCIKISVCDRTAFSVNGNGGDFLFFISHRYLNRKDHIDTMKKIASTVPEHDLAYPYDKRRLCIRPFNLICLAVWFIQMNAMGLGIKGKMHYIYYMLLARNYLYSVRNRMDLSQYQVVVFRMDGQLYDNIIAQHVKIQGGICVTTQDGYEVGKCVEAEYEWQLQAKLRGSISHYCMAWSPFFVEILRQTVTEEQKIVPVGMPKFIDFGRTSQGEKKYFGILLDFSSDQDSNMEMIRIANKISRICEMPYIMRYHPSQTDGRYNEMTNDINGVRIESTPQISDLTDFAETCLFVLGCNSSTVLECAFLNEYVYRFKPSDDKDLLKECRFPNTFTSYKELYQMIESGVRIPESYRDYVCGKKDVEKSYREFFVSILE